jgi:hypothetical protein
MTTGKSGFMGFVRNHPVVVAVLMGIIAVVVVYYWQQIKMNKEMKQTISKVNEQLLTRDKEMLEELSKPLVWSIRADMMRDNLEQTNLLMTDLIREEHYQFMHLADPSGIILLSTDKKLQGQNVDSLFDSSLLRVDSIHIVDENTDLLLAAAPVMGYDKRLGTLFIGYRKAKFNN